MLFVSKLTVIGTLVVNFSVVVIGCVVVVVGALVVVVVVVSSYLQGVRIVVFAVDDTDDKPQTPGTNIRGVFALYGSEVVEVVVTAVVVVVVGSVVVVGLVVVVVVG